MWDSGVICEVKLRVKGVIAVLVFFLMKVIPYNLVFIQLSKVPIYNASIKFWQ